MGDPYTECAGFMTFGPGSTYGRGGPGTGAESGYMVLTWIGIVFMVLPCSPGWCTRTVA